MTPRGSGFYVELLRALGETLRAAGPAEAWARCAEAELRALDPAAPVFDDRRGELSRALAHCYEHVLRRPDAALRHLRSLADGPAARALRPQDANEIEAALLRLLRLRAGPIELEARLAAQLERGPASAEDWLELARLRDEKLHAGARAEQAYRRALELAPDSLDALRGLRGVAERLGAWDVVAETLEREVEQSASAPPGERAALLRATRRRRLAASAIDDARQPLLRRRARSRPARSRGAARARSAARSDGGLARRARSLRERGRDAGRSRSRATPGRLAARGRDRARPHERAGARVARLRTSRGARRARAGAAAASGPSCTCAVAIRRRSPRCSRAGATIRERTPAPADHLRLAETLETLGRSAEALARVERSLALEPAQRTAWKLAARAHEMLAEGAGAAQAWARAAELADGSDAADSLLRAAELQRGDDARQALDWLERAARHDPGAPGVWVALAASRETCGEPAAALAAAERALELLASSSTPTQRSDVAPSWERAAPSRSRSSRQRCAASSRCSRRRLAISRRRRASARRSSASETSPAHAPASRRAARARDPYASRARHLVLIGRCLEADREEALALERFEAALALEPANRDAHEHIAASHERAGRTAPALAALERWAQHCDDPALRAGCLLRAAELELRQDGRQSAAEQHLRAALAADPGQARAGLLLATLLSGDATAPTRRSRSPRARSRARRDAAGASGPRAAARAPARTARRDAAGGRGLRGRRASRSAQHAGRRLRGAPAARAGTMARRRGRARRLRRAAPGRRSGGSGGRSRPARAAARGPARRRRRRDPGLSPRARARARADRDAHGARPAAEPAARRLARGAATPSRGAGRRSDARSVAARRAADRRGKRTPGSRRAGSGDPARPRRGERSRARGRAGEPLAIPLRERRARRSRGRDRSQARAASGRRDRRGARLLSRTRWKAPARATSPPSDRPRSRPRVA